MEEWKECKLGDYCDFQNGYAFKSSEFKTNGEYKIVKIKELKDGLVKFFDDSASVDIHDIKEFEKYKIYRNDVLFALTGYPVSKPNPLSWVGRVSIYRSDENALLNQRTCKIKKSDEIDNQFLYYYFRQWENFYVLASKATGSASQANISTNTIADTIIKLPPLPTQQKIADILSSLDDKIELNNKINTNLEQQAQDLFKNWFVDKYEKEGTIGDYCAVKSGFAFKSAWWQDEGTKVIRIGDIEQGCLNLETCAHVATDKIEVAKDFIVQGGDLVIAMTGATIGKFSMIPKTQEPILVNQRVGKFFLGNNPIEKVPFIYCTLKQEEVITEFINRGQGSAQPNISTGDILSIPCWIPNKNEIDNFNKTIQPMFETIISNQEENRKLSVLRDSLLPKLMNGEIEV